MRPRLLFLAALLLAATGMHPVAENPRFLTDEQGRALILHGINVSNSTKDDPLRLPFVEQADVQRLADDFGFNFVRFLLQWDAIEPVEGVYDDVYLGWVAERMQWFADAGIYVVLDMHQDVYGKIDRDGRYIGHNGAPPWAFLTDGLPFEPQPSWFLDYLQPAILRAFDNFWDHAGHPDLQDRYAAAWAHVAARFRDTPNVLGYDLMNEPWPGSAFFGDIAGWEGGAYQEFLERCIAAIRTVDSDGWIFYEPRSVGVNAGQPSYLGVLDDVRAGEPRLAYFPHYYAIGPDVTGVWDPETDTSLEDWAANRKTEIDAQVAPLLIGEWGTGRGVVNWRGYLEAVARMADHTASGWAFWDYSLGGWGPIDGERNETETADVLTRAYPQRVAGTPRFVDFDPATRVLRVEFDEKPGVTGATEIYVPAGRHYPEGFELVTSDPGGSWSQSWDPTRELLSYVADPESAQHVVEIRPVPEAGALAGGLSACAVLGVAAARRRRRRIGAAAIGLAFGASGCALDGPGSAPPGAPPKRVRPPAHYEDHEGYEAPAPRSAIDHAYDDGYSRGWGDREQGRTPDYERWTGEYDRGGEPGFRAGYADGYQRRPHRYGEAGPDVTPVAPDWLVGEFTGWDERERVEVVLQVRRDGGVRLVGGGRAQEGVYRNGRLELRKGAWRVERTRSGLVIAPEWDQYGSVALTRR
ncbi:MAG: cellulase family glycosylhydrolase [Deltaproteobacteria bacterium]|nr:cellulase family glycosylhydrolase [Deltaproteobacteria bacterium]